MTFVISFDFNLFFFDLYEYYNIFLTSKHLNQFSAIIILTIFDRKGVFGAGPVRTQMTRPLVVILTFIKDFFSLIDFDVKWHTKAVFLHVINGPNYKSTGLTFSRNSTHISSCKANFVRHRLLPVSSKPIENHCIFCQ